MKADKRILKISLERVPDDCPDTSHLGEYSSHPDGDYSINRKHSLECPVNNPHISQPIVDQLERVLRHIWEHEKTIGNDSDNPYYWGLFDAADIVADAQDRVTECDCESGDWTRNEYEYFNTSGNYLGLPMADIVTYTKQDYARAESLQAENWYFLGVTARAVVVIGGVRQQITSGGLWGIESDSEESYLQEEEQNQLAELRTILYTMGFSKRAIASAVKQAGLSR